MSYVALSDEFLEHLDLFHVRSNDEVEHVHRGQGHFSAPEFWRQDQLGNFLKWLFPGS